MQHPVAFCKGKEDARKREWADGKDTDHPSSVSQDKDFGFKANFLHHTTLTKEYFDARHPVARGCNLSTRNGSKRIAVS